MSKSPNLQDVFLASVRRTETPVTVFLMNGFQMRGKTDYGVRFLYRGPHR